MYTITYTMDGERGNFERSFDNGAEAYSFAEYAREMGKVVEIRIDG